MMRTIGLGSRIVNGVWYEVCVSQGGEVREVIEESNKKQAMRRADQLAEQWPNCDMVFIRQHTLEPKRGLGASKFIVLHKLTLDFRKDMQSEPSRAR